MERTKGKIEILVSRKRGWSVELLDKDGKNVLEDCTCNKAQENALHLVECWNAFEDGGLVGEMKKTLRAFVDHFDGGFDSSLNSEVWMSNEGTEIIEEAIAVLARAKKEGVEE